jgi:predicted alpha/beta-fold hydrolase
MPIIRSEYNPPFPFKNGHLSTIYSGIIRKVTGLAQQRERLELGDGDFLDLDWSYAAQPAEAVVILLHGLEGNAQRPYITGSAKQFNVNGIDACAVNFRGCSGTSNRLYRSYHSGATEDLEAVIGHILTEKQYTTIYLKGFSLGGNMTLKYLGEGRSIPKEIKGAVAVSVPCSLHNSLLELLKPKNIMYAARFKKHLIEKLREKQVLFPDRISDLDIAKINNLKDFDDIYTSRAHGFEDAIDYYKKSSALQFIQAIRTPTLIINAQNDSFLGDQCYPFKEAEHNKYVHFELSLYGGHVGFYDQKNITYTEKRALKFLEGLY